MTVRGDWEKAEFKSGLTSELSKAHMFALVFARVLWVVIMNWCQSEKSTQAHNEKNLPLSSQIESNLTNIWFYLKANLKTDFAAFTETVSLSCNVCWMRVLQSVDNHTGKVMKNISSNFPNLLPVKRSCTEIAACRGGCTWFPPYLIWLGVHVLKKSSEK